MKKSELPNITKKQKEILLLLYKFRFLTRIQIQTILNHKHHNRINNWLIDLTKKHYLIQYYDKSFAGAPAIYSLGINSRKYLKENTEENEVFAPLLDRIWREKNFTITFRDHCLFLGDIFISVRETAKRNDLELHFLTKTNLSIYEYMLKPIPDAYIVFKKKDGEHSRFFIDVFDPLPPRMMLRKRVRQYFNYFAAGYWQENTPHPFPMIILICPDEKSMRYLDRFIQSKLEDENELVFFLTTREKVKEKGLRREVLQLVEEKE
jgi:hypothetical protein